MPHSPSHGPNESRHGPPQIKPPFDIDNYINPFVPRNPLHLLPAWISYWFGHRAPRQSHPPQPPHRPFHTLILYLSVMIGAFCGVAIIESVFIALPPLSGHTVPIVIASFGAAAILEYNTIESPLAQPRSLVLGHVISAVVGVGITKLFEHLPADRFDDLRWLAGALSVGVASMLMSFTKTVHPPAGATALLAATDIQVQQLGWWLIPLVLLAATLMLASALVLNNAAGRRFPTYWWTPVNLTVLQEERRKEPAREPASGDMEKGNSEAFSDVATEAGSHVYGNDVLRPPESALTRMVSMSAASRIPRRLSLARASQSSRRDEVVQLGRTSTAGSHPHRNREHETETAVEEEEPGDYDGKIVITETSIITPDWLELSDWEDEVLRILMERLRDQ